MEERSLGGFVPVNDAHAISAVTAQITFSTPVPDDAWPLVRKAARSFGVENDLGIPQSFFATSVSFEPNSLALFSSVPGHRVNQSNGLVFTIQNENDIVTDRIIIARDHLSFHTSEYLRWEPLFTYVSNFLDQVWSSFTSNSTCNSVRLEYIDVFICKKIELADAFAVIRKESKFITTSAPENDYWFSHSGYFTRLNERVRRHEINRIEYGEQSTPDGEAERSITITTSVTDAVGAPGYETPEGNEFAFQAVLDTLNVQHDLLKSTLSGIITTEASQRIGL